MNVSLRNTSNINVKQLFTVFGIVWVGKFALVMQNSSQLCFTDRGLHVSSALVNEKLIYEYRILHYNNPLLIIFPMIQVYHANILLYTTTLRHVRLALIVAGWVTGISVM